MWPWKITPNSSFFHSHDLPLFSSFFSPSSPLISFFLSRHHGINSRWTEACSIVFLTLATTFCFDKKWVCLQPKNWKGESRGCDKIRFDIFFSMFFSSLSWTSQNQIITWIWSKMQCQICPRPQYCLELDSSRITYFLQ